MFYIQNMVHIDEPLAHKDSKGQHDKLTTVFLADAKAFKTCAEAFDYCQNFDDDWQIVHY